MPPRSMVIEYTLGAVFFILLLLNLLFLQLLQDRVLKLDRKSVV